MSDHLGNWHKPETSYYYGSIYDLATQFIELNFGSPNLTLKNFCCENNLSMRTAQRCFSLHGTTWRHQVQDIKMLKSRGLILNTAYNIKSIAKMSGYNSSSQFVRAFKRHYEITPERLREKSRLFDEFNVH